MMIISISMAAWSTGDNFRAGLWFNCAKDSSNSWYCGSVRDPIQGNAMMVTARVCTIWGLSATFWAMVFAYIAMFTDHKFVGFALLGLILMGFTLLCISWGTWIGVHSEFYEDGKMGLDLASSFIMCCVSAGFLFLAFYLALIGLVWGRRQGRSKRAKEVAMCEPYACHANAYAAPAAYAPAFAPAPPMYPMAPAAPMYPVVDTPYTSLIEVLDDGPAPYFY